MGKVFYKGAYYNTIKDGLSAEDIEKMYGGFGEEDCYSPDCSAYCLIVCGGDTIAIPECGCLMDEPEVSTGCLELDCDVDLSDPENLVDLLNSEGVLVGPIEMFLIDQPIDDCDLVVDCRIDGEKHSVFLKLCDSITSSRASMKKRISDSSSLYSKKHKKEQLVDSLKSKARLFRNSILSKCYIKDDAEQVVATTSNGDVVLTRFDSDSTEDANTFLESNEGTKIVKSDETGIYIGNDDVDADSVTEIKEVSDRRYPRKESQGILDSFGKIFNGRWAFVGEVGRGVPDFKHVDVVVDSSKSDVMKRLKSIKGVKRIKDCSEFVRCECDGVPFLIYPAEGSSFVPTTILMTGTDEFNVMLLANAILNGCYFTEDGVYDEDGECYSFIDEQDCFNACGVEYVEPYDRNCF